jgi:hypothetical protein
MVLFYSPLSNFSFLLHLEGYLLYARYLMMFTFYKSYFPIFSIVICIIFIFISIM